MDRLFGYNLPQPRPDDRSQPQLDTRFESRPDYLPLYLPTDEAPPSPGDAELLADRDREYLDSFFGAVGPSSNRAPMDPEALSAVYTMDWRMPVSVVGHGISTNLGKPDDVQAPDMSCTAGFWDEPSSAASASASQPLPLHYNVPPTPDDLAAANALAYGMFTAQGTQTPPLAPQQAMIPAQYQTMGSEASQLQLARIRAATQAQLAQARAAQFTVSPNPYIAAGSAAGFGAPGGGPAYNPPPQFGTDPRFTPSSYVPPSANESSEALETQRMASLGCLHPDNSAAPSRVASPAPAAAQSANAPVLPDRRRTIPRDPPAPDQPPSRRRRTSRKSEVAVPAVGLEPPLPPPASSIPELNGTAPPQPPAAPSPTAITAPPKKQRRATAPGKTPSTAPPPPKKRNGRGSATAGARKSSPRTPLTEEQRRQNHVGSEQRRREEIKAGYRLLAALVPQLRQGAHSKAVQLTVATEWIRDVMEGNQRLREMLA
ncbi:hypothetical protein C8A01DRAFT_33664 [Parachaetomium inaequale]|uniref:BHLH domain-containing protein n=1 Tax=Parachaetomium inaequale TaxID=2588326 RepID=A0AAN6PLM8_9PEZI|nr:hypothetical protein C8A01DRAFT_33664 [Parachaetomium inaequale]